MLVKIWNEKINVMRNIYIKETQFESAVTWFWS